MFGVVSFVRVKVLFLCVLIVFIGGLFFILFSVPSIDPVKCSCNKIESDALKSRKSTHKLGVIVPFRDRFEELLEFLPHITSFLGNQSIYHETFVINQVDEHRFNRASLINVGFKEACSRGCDYIVMHDVDLLPLNPDLVYGYPGQHGVYHIAAPHLHPRYHYDKFIGGILLLSKEVFEKVNGMSNRYWGWGLEDDEFYVRLISSGHQISRPANITTSPTDTFRHLHGKKRKRDSGRCYNQREVTRRRDRKTGLSNVQYTIESKKQLVVEGAVGTVINTRLHCNTSLTPWCNC